MSARFVAKRTIKAAFLVFVTPLYAAYRLLSLFGAENGTFQSFSQLISLIPGKTGVYVRAAFYRLACPDTSDDISIGFLTILSHRNTTIHPGVYIGPQCNIGKCEIGEDTLLGSGVHVLSGSRQHFFDNPTKPIKQQGGHFEKIKIGSDCWIGNGSLVMAPVEPHSIVAAGSIVTKPVPEKVIVSGQPARVIRQR